MKEKCPLCNHNHVTILAKEKKLPFTNLQGTIKEFVLVSCEKCYFIFQQSAYTKSYDALIDTVYKKYISSTTFNFPRQDKTNMDSIDFILPYIKENSNILEIGSARGDFLYLLKEKIPSVNILGVEPSVETSYVPTINRMYTNTLFTNTFDLIIIRHTLEHIKYPKKFIKQLKPLLKKDSFLYIEVPNIKLNVKYLTEDFEPDHVSYFSLESLKFLFKKFKVIASNEKTFLRVLFQPSKKLTQDEIKPFTDNKTIKHIFNNKKKFFKQMKTENKKIVFYGVSNYYYFFVFQFSKIRNLNNCYYFDDNFNEPFEPKFNLPRITSLEDCIVITCSNVPYVQDAMGIKLKGINCKIIKPWRQI